VAPLSLRHHQVDAATRSTEPARSRGITGELKRQFGMNSIVPTPFLPACGSPCGSQSAELPAASSNCDGNDLCEFIGSPLCPSSFRNRAAVSTAAPGYQQLAMIRSRATVLVFVGLLSGSGWLRLVVDLRA
jgi:hypothetical protein